MLGMHGAKAANLAVQEADLLIAVGARFDDRVTGKAERICPHAKVIPCGYRPASWIELRQTHVSLACVMPKQALPLLSQPLSFPACSITCETESRARA